jgi:DNA-binding LytR/AlgR family response regulator
MKSNLTSNLEQLQGLNLRDRLNSSFPYWLNDNRKNLIMITAISVFVIGFMLVYRPLNNFEQEIRPGIISVFGGITFVILSISIMLLPRLFPVAFDPVNWTLQKYLLQTVLQCFVIGALAVAVDKVYVCPEKTVGEIAVHAYTQVALIGIIPVTIITLVLKNTMLQENLKEAILANQQLEKIRNLKNDVNKSDLNKITIYSDTSDTLSFNLPDLLFIQADDNYSTVHWLEGAVVQKKLLRVNLKNLESQINNSFTIRCHRSYIVNVHAISSVTGNTNGYKLRVKDTEHFIPVSRQKGKVVMEKIQELKNMMELY